MTIPMEVQIPSPVAPSDCRVDFGYFRSRASTNGASRRPTSELPVPISTGHHITVHCTVTRQQSRRDGYLEEFVRIWSANPDTKQIWISLYTPQIGESSDERLMPADRERVVAALRHLRGVYPKLTMPATLIDVYADPPQSPAECIFAQTTTCVSADFERRIEPCQFGGTPDCSSCGCIASVKPAAVGHQLLLEACASARCSTARAKRTGRRMVEYVNTPRIS